MMKLAVIVPAYNEEENIGKCLESLVRQTFRPQQIIVVDDGSTDGTLDVVSRYNDGSFQIVRRPRHEKGNIQRVPYVIRDGSRLLDGDTDFVAILDADTILEREYYAKIVDVLTRRPDIGIAGGKLVNQPETGLVLGMFQYVYGCNRVYTVECWVKVNSGMLMQPVPAWDTYHNLCARMFGFTPTRFDFARSWSLRIARTSSPFEKGYASYQLGYPLWFTVGRSVKNFTLSMLAGYLKAWAVREQQYPVKKIVRQMQVQRVANLLKHFL
jgi:glycosyltransferase involved in cell wall biosynthesis